MTSEASSATRGSAIRLSAELGSRALAMATVFLLSVGLGVAGFGRWAALAGIAAIVAQVANAGTQELACRVLLAARASLGALLRARGVLTAAVLALAAGLALAAVAGRAPSGALVLAVLVADAVITGWVEFLGTVLRARGRRGEEAVLLLLARGGGLAAVALALGARWDLLGVALAHTASTAVPLALAVVFARRSAPGDLSPGSASGASMRALDVLRLSWPLALNSGLALASLRLEMLALLYWRSPAEAGLFALALKVVESLNGIPGAISAGALPALTREALAQGPPAARERTARTIALLAVPGAALLSLLAPRLTAAWSASYAPAGPCLRVLALALVPMFMNALLLHCLIAAGRPQRLPVLTAARVATAAAMAVLLVPRAGAIGAASGFLTAELVLFALAARSCAAASFAVPLASALGWGAVTATIAYARRPHRPAAEVQ